MLNVLPFASFLLIVLIGVPLWWNAIGRTVSGGEILATRDVPPSPLGFVDVLILFLMWFVAQIATTILALPWLGLSFDGLAEATGTQLAWLSIIAATTQLISTGIALAIIYLRYRRPVAIGWCGDYLFDDIMIGVKAFFMVIPTILLVQWLLTMIIDYNHASLEMLSQNGTGLTISAVWLSAGLVAPICEEVFFRGILQGWLQRIGVGSSANADQKLIGGWGEDELRMIDSGTSRLPSDQWANQPPSPTIPPALDSNPFASPRNQPAKIIGNLLPGSHRPGLQRDTLWPIFVTAALFALTHLGQGPAPIPLFLFGLALGYLFRKTGTILPCVILHMMLNGFSLFWFTLGVLQGEPGTEVVMGRGVLWEWLY